MNFDVDDYVAFAEHQLTPQRFKHSLGVMHVMSDLAAIYNLNKTTAMTAGILHDITKEFTSDELLKWASEHNIVLNTEQDRDPLFLHGPVGASYVAQELGISDPMLLDAISRHSYFPNGVTISPSFCWCLRFADMLEPSRDWKDLRSQLKPFVYSGKLGEGAYTLVRWIIPFHEAISLPVHPNLYRLVQELSTFKNDNRLDEISKLPT